MKKVLCIGNNLVKHGNTATSLVVLGELFEREGFTVIYASSQKNKLLRMLDMILKTLRYARKVDYVLIDTYSTINFWYALVVSQLCRLLRVKYIPKLLGGDLPHRLEKSKFLCELIFRNAYRNVAPSLYLYESFKSKGYNNLVHIPNSIEIEKYHFDSKTFDSPKILWVRSFAQLYNPILAVKVLIEVQKKHPQATLCMVGPKKDDSYEETVAFAKQNNVPVTFTGKLTKKEWANLSKHYNLFLNTTHFDNTPVSVIEAIALGLPVVSTNVGGIPFLLQHEKTALLVNDNDLQEMVFQIERLFSEPKLANALVINAYDLVKGFDWKIIRKHWIHLLE
ncbi:MAG: glycosyltransferase family 4 protein [Flavobacterium sp.]|nr:glycosyltransferase family 4 protein [Flavobacterium sp.]MBP8156964.1 glycosyltransferase family 4 protein [Flavobacterium sp.]